MSGNSEAPVDSNPREPRSFEFSPQYRSALLRCLCLQAVLFLLTAMILDGGRINQFCIVAIASHWVGIVLIMGRRPLLPTKTDLLFIRYGIVPLVVITPFLADGVWDVIGKSAQSGVERWLPRS